MLVCIEHRSLKKCYLFLVESVCVFVFMGALRANSSLNTWEIECISCEASSLFILELINYFVFYFIYFFTLIFVFKLILVIYFLKWFKIFFCIEQIKFFFVSLKLALLIVFKYWWFLAATQYNFLGSFFSLLPFFSLLR